MDTRICRGYARGERGLPVMHGEPQDLQLISSMLLENDISVPVSVRVAIGANCNPGCIRQLVSENYLHSFGRKEDGLESLGCGLY